MIHIKEAIVVEGIYDKKKLCEFLNAVIITTDGFSVFQDKEKIKLLRTLAEKNGLVILTDSDRAGFKIRNHLKSHLDLKYIKNAFIPEIKGKEKRKTAASKDGLLGVEAIEQQAILDALIKAGCNIDGNCEVNPKNEISKSDLYEDGFFGGAKASEKRKMLTEYLNLPGRISANSLLQILNSFYDKNAYKKIIRDFEKIC